MRTKDIAERNAAVLKARAGSYFGYVDVDFLSCPPFVMFSNGDCSVAQEIVTTGAFERGSLELWLKLCQSGSLAVDVGAYTGIFALAAALSQPTLQVLAFEPNPFTCGRLRLNCVVNGARNVKDHFAAIGSASDLVRLNWVSKESKSLPSTATLASFSRVPPHMIETAVVPRMPLAASDLPAGAREHIVIKIDVEGAERDVFDGLASLLPLKPDIILETFNAKACAQIAARLAPYGYAYGLIDEETGRILPQETLIPADPAARNRNQFLTARSHSMDLGTL